MNKRVVKNFIYAFGAQAVSLASSLAITFFASALIGVKEFAYWQLFLTYVSYVSITRLGINDGLYLRIGGKHYSELNYNLLSRERRLFIGYQTVIAIFLAIITTFSSIEADRKFILLSCILCIVIVNANGYLIYILQAVNRTSIYSTSVVLQNLTWFVAVAIIVFLKIYSYKVIVVMYILGHILAGIYLAYNAKEIVKHRSAPIKLVLDDIKENISCGIKLMISTYAGNFIVSSCRLIIDAAWGVEVFGIFSFSLTLANVILTFINQISIIVFPALRRVSNDKIKSVYITLRDTLGLILPLVMLGYLPIVLLVNVFLPQYSQSLSYLPIFLPICTFDGKMQMMCSSFFKSMRKESALLYINLSTLVASITMALIGSFLVKDVMFVALGILFVIAMRSIISELLLARWMKVSIVKNLIQEIILVVLFVVGSFVLTPIKMFVFYAVIYALFLFLNRDKIVRIIRQRKEL